LIKPTRRALGLAALGAAVRAAQPQPRTRSFHLEYKAMLPDLDPGSKRVDVWVPAPHDDAWQKIRNLRVESPHSYEMATATQGNSIVHVRIDGAAATGVVLAMNLDATRAEHVLSSVAAEPPGDLAQYLRPDRLVPLDDQIRAWAREVVRKAHANTDLEMGRAIYNHVVATVKYDKTGKGWGRGDIYYACQERRGNCTDFHAIFIGYSRALGIPARFAIGFPLPPDRGSGKIAGYHCWAEFYAKGTGWVPVDASEAAKDPSKREYFFGAHDEHRIEFSKGRDIMLVPRQMGEPLNYFVYPYAEVDGRPLPGIAHEITYRDTVG
jgi:transglutaminase-like putative cysteine protease